MSRAAPDNAFTDSTDPMRDSATAGAADAPADAETVVKECSFDVRHSPAEVLARLDTASRRGRLPGFLARPREGVLFTLELHGRPFDGVMVATASPLEGSGSQGSRLMLRWRMLPQMPAAFAVILIATVWPGVYFMDRLIPGSWTWIPEFGSWWPATWWWYIPVTALPLPWAWRVLMRRSREAIEEAAGEAVGKVKKELA